ncbi:MAG TPA: hypothetical protein DET40_11055 [Lentisphaeria bacterium]|nr:MAG: hypothetical protein A2X45_20135 [Lentisphaerae bacterium GWF2_50_93]HCE44076.1 hypothetical protein [Lentisphaeria bacterium]
MSIMMKRILGIILFLAAGQVFSGDVSAILSENRNGSEKSNFLPEGTKFIDTGATCKWITEGEYATDEETLKTGASNRVLFDGNNGESWKSHTYSKWGKGQWATLVVDLKEQYLIDLVDVWFLHEESRDTEKAEILMSLDGKDFNIHGTAKDNQNLPLKNKEFIKICHKFEKPVLSRYVMLRIKRRQGAFQQQIGEVVIWGRNVADNTNYLKADDKPTVDFSAVGIQAGAVFLDWSSFPGRNEDVRGWKIYCSEKPFKLVTEDNVRLMQQADAKSQGAPVYPLKPGTTYYLGVTALYEKGEYPDVKCLEYRTPAILECRTFKDMLAVNHFWGGGGNRQKRPNVETWEEIALELLGTSPLRQIRWWKTDQSKVKKYYQRGIGMMAYPHGENIRQATNLGINLFAGAANEPDLSGKSIEQYVSAQKGFYQAMKKNNPEALMTAPSSGLEDTSIEWLKKFYELGGKENFDVLDLHTYCKISGGHKVPEGYPAGAPEAMFDNMRKVREVVSQFNDAAKPVISTEFGYTDCETNNPSGKINQLVQAQYLVRGLVIHYVLGFKRVFIYSFWDEGSDPNYTEHHFGMIDFELQKKPSFYALQTLARQLGNCVLEKQMECSLLPGMAYLFKDVKTNEYVSVIWDGSGNAVGKFQTSSTSVGITDIFGKERKIAVLPDGSFSLAYGPSLTYLRSSQPISQLEQKAVKVSGGDEQGLKVELGAKAIIQPSGSAAEVKVVMKNASSKEAKVNLRILDSKGNTVVEKDSKVPPIDQKTETISFSPGMEGSILARFTLVATYEDGYSSYTEELPFHVRCLEGADNTQMTRQVRMAGTDHGIYLISNPFLEVSFDADCGGRVLEIIDRKNKTSQVNINYELISNLQKGRYTYGIWDQLNNQLRDSPFKVLKAESGRLVLEGTTKEKLSFVKDWCLEKNQLRLKLQIRNESEQEQVINYYMHPEYTVGGTGDSVSDVFLLPASEGIVRMPFWTGLGEKKTGILTEKWWGVLDTVSGEFLRQDFSADNFQQPGIWFGQGAYSMDMNSVSGMKLMPGKSWNAEMAWTILNDRKKDFDGRTDKDEK